MTGTVWVVCWRGIVEERAGRQDAMDRWGELDARGIEAEVFEIAAGGRERSVGLMSTLRLMSTPQDQQRASQPERRSVTGEAKSGYPTPFER